jgi:hypothetical protein
MTGSTPRRHDADQGVIEVTPTQHLARRVPTGAAHRTTRTIEASPAQGSGILTTTVGLAFPKELTFDAWQQAGLRVARIVNSSAWYLGDWLVYGQQHYVDRYKRAIDLVGLDYQTLRNYAWVARKVEYPRRRQNLSFQHHAEVAALDPDDQSRWLLLAEQNDWSRNQLRHAVRGSDGGAARDKRPVLPWVSVPDARVEAWRRAAAEADVEFGAWVVMALDQVAGTALGQVGATGR